jgi:hypothetical protein
MDPRIEMAAFLINLGLTTVQKVKEIFASEGHDDEVLAVIMAEVDQRLKRRG